MTIETQELPSHCRCKTEARRVGVAVEDLDDAAQEMRMWAWARLRRGKKYRLRWLASRARRQLLSQSINPINRTLSTLQRASELEYAMLSEEHIEKNIDAELVHQVLSKLEEGDRYLLTHIDMGIETCTSLAHEVGCTRAGVHYRLQQARKRFREIYEHSTL